MGSEDSTPNGTPSGTGILQTKSKRSNANIVLGAGFPGPCSPNPGETKRLIGDSNRDTGTHESRPGEEEDGNPANSGRRTDQENRPLENPSTDIRADLEDVFENGLNFEGSFYFSQTYHDAPNPLLRLDKLGHVGLPLSQREAKCIAQHARQAPFGMGERTVVDTNVRDTWETDASEVHFDNPKWTHFLNRVVQEVCERLGVEIAASRPRCELYKLLLYETGSHFLPHQDTEKADGMFATIVIVLPSSFAGGAAHLSHAGQSVIVDQSKGSLTNTSVMAWYTDVMHEIKPIESGYRLALSYNLIHTTTSLRPALTDTTQSIQRLRHILRSWRQQISDEDSPEKIIYLLQHRYSHANYRGSALKGSDAQVVAIVESVGKELGFRVGLALVECHLRGGADDGGNTYHPPPAWRLSSDDEPPDSDDLEFLEVYEKTMTITELVDLDGRPLKKKLKLTDEDEDGTGVEFIPADLREEVENGPHDEQDYEGYQGNGAGSLERWYRRTVLVIWPDQHDRNVLDGRHYAQFVLRMLSATSSEKPTEAEQTMLDYAFGLPPKEPSFAIGVLRSVCKASCVWKSPQLWCRAMNVCDGSATVEKLGKELYLEALLCLDSGAVIPCVHQVLQREPQNAIRLSLLDFLEQRLTSRDLPTEWVAVARSDVLASHHAKPELVLDAAVSAGGIVALDRSGLLQLRDNATQAVLSGPEVEIRPRAGSLVQPPPKRRRIDDDVPVIDLRTP